MTYRHYPVLHQELLYAIKKIKPYKVLDLTFGLGGHTKLILENTNAIITAVDCDMDTLPWVDNLQKLYPQRLIFINKKFKEALLYLYENNEIFDFILGDFGISTMQLDNHSRGFSYTYDGPLNMAMDHNNHRCLWLVNEAPIKALADVIKNYGEERNYYNIAKNIISHRPIYTTLQLRKAIEEKIYDKKFTNKTLSRVFQSIRIYTNNELEEINFLFNNINKISNNNTNYGWVYFHSLEGNYVHQWYKKLKKNNYNMKIIRPSEKELMENNPSKSAYLVLINHKIL